MPITIHWDNEDKTIVYQRYDGPWTWDEFSIGVDQLKALLDEVDYRVDIFLDLSTFETPVDFMTRIKVMDEVLVQLQPKLRYAIAYETPGLMQAIIRVARTLFTRVARQVIVVETREDALAFLDKNPHPGHITNQS